MDYRNVGKGFRMGASENQEWKKNKHPVIYFEELEDTYHKIS